MKKSLHLKKIWLSNSRKGKLEDYYDVNISTDVIGQGTFAKVVQATTKQGHYKRAIKILLKRRISDRNKFNAEIELHRHLDHPNIVRLYETFEDYRNVYMVMELCKGGEMFDRIVEKGMFTESEARNLFTQIIRAINFCHSNGVCHRDVKPENFLFVDKEPNSHIKLSDFGLSKKFVNPEDNSKITMTEKVGTSYYIAPEVLEGSYDESCDIWSAGVVLYILLCGVPPFNGATDDEIIEKVLDRDYSFKGAVWDKVSSSAKDLIKHMLCDEKSRIKPEEVLKHPWMLQEENKNEKPLPINYETLKNFVNFSKLKKVAIAVIASQLSEEEISELASQFNQLDKNGDGVLSFDEIQERLSEIDEKAREDLVKVLGHVITDKSRKINYTEFIAASMEKSMYLKEEKLIEAFKAMDKDGNGKISTDELIEIIGKDPTFDKADYDQIIKEADANGDGTIDYREFVEMMKTS